jgi:hypothetical protein
MATPLIEYVTNADTHRRKPDACPTCGNPHAEGEPLGPYEEKYPCPLCEKQIEPEDLIAEAAIDGKAVHLDCFHKKFLTNLTNNLSESRDEPSPLLSNRPL